MNRLRTGIVAALIALVAGSSIAQCPTDAQMSQLAGNQAVVKIDLATGGVDGRQIFATTTQVQLQFVNRNPFREYDIKLSETVVAEPALAAIGKLFPELAALTAAAAPATASASAAAAQPAASDALAGAKARAQRERPGCNEAYNGARNTAVRAADRLATAWAAVGGPARSVREVVSQAEGVVAAVARAKPGVLAPGLTCEAVQAAGGALSRAYDTTGVGTALRNLGTAVDAFFDLTLRPPGVEGSPYLEYGRSWQASVDQVRNACGDLADPLLTNIPDQRPAYDEKRAEIAVKRAAVDTFVTATAAEKAAVDAILADNSKFYFLRSRGPYLDPTRVDVAVKSKVPEDKAFPDATVATAALHFGGRRRFALGIGAAFSNLETPEFGGVQAIERDAQGQVVRDANGAAKVKRVVGQTNKSDGRAVPMLVLHTRLYEGGGLVSGYHASLGLSGKADNKGTDVEYLVGVSASFAEERFFVTAGVYNGRVQALREGFSIGDELPAAITDVPVRKDRHWKPVVALSYRFN